MAGRKSAIGCGYGSASLESPAGLGIRKSLSTITMALPRCVAGGWWKREEKSLAIPDKQISMPDGRIGGAARRVKTRCFIRMCRDAGLPGLQASVCRKAGATVGRPR